MSSEQEIFEDLRNFIFNERWRYKKELTKATKLEDDLGITGDDALEFMEHFFKYFNVDYEHFKPNRYFEPEGFGLVNFEWLLGIKKREARKKDLTLGDLEKAITLGYWPKDDESD